MKKSTLTIISILFSILAWAQQWSGTNPINTTSGVEIQNSVYTASTTTPPPILNVFTIDYSGIPAYTTNHLYIDGVGRVGIGLSNPTASLHIKGNLLVSYYNGTNILNADNWSFTYGSTNTMNFNTSSGEFLLTKPSSATNIFKVNGNGIVNVYNDLVISDNTGINCRIYQNGLIRSREVKVDLLNIPPDYVFGKNYKLLPFDELRNYLLTNKHLPGIPSASEMQEEGSINVGDMQFKLLEKVEELTLYILQLQKQNEELKKRVCKLEKE